MNSSGMKLVTAVVKPHRLAEVKTGLQAVGVSGLTVTEVRGFGRQLGHTEVYRGTEYQVDFVPKIKVEVLVASDLVDAAVEAIVTGARTGSIGDGKIWVRDCDSVQRIRTGEEGIDAV